MVKNIQQICGFVLTIGIVLLTSGCINKKGKSELFSTKSICKSIWREKFKVYSGGAHSAELFSDYLTDSINFRKFIGTHDEWSSFDYECDGDKIIVKKYAHDGHTKKVSKVFSFEISKLVIHGKFE